MHMFSEGRSNRRPVRDRCGLGLGRARKRQIRLGPPRLSLRFQEAKQLGVNNVGMRRNHAMRVVFVCLQRAILEELG